MNYIQLIQDQALVIRAHLLFVLLALVTKSCPLYSTCQNSYDILQNPKQSCTKSHKIPNDISCGLAHNTGVHFCHIWMSNHVSCSPKAAAAFLQPFCSLFSASLQPFSSLFAAFLTHVCSLFDACLQPF